MSASSRFARSAESRLLLVEDMPEVRDIVAMVLRAAGWSVAVAPDARTALALSASERWQVAVLDVDLPDLSGMQLLMHLRQLPGAAQLPAVFITGRPDRERRAAIAALGGAVCLLPKPFAAADLVSAVDVCFRGALRA